MSHQTESRSSKGRVCSGKALRFVSACLRRSELEHCWNFFLWWVICHWQGTAQRLLTRSTTSGCRGSSDVIIHSEVLQMGRTRYIDWLAGYQKQSWYNSPGIGTRRGSVRTQAHERCGKSWGHHRRGWKGGMYRETLVFSAWRARDVNNRQNHSQSDRFQPILMRHQSEDCLETRKTTG